MASESAQPHARSPPHHARREEHRQLPETGVVWGQERSAPAERTVQPCLAQAASPLRRQHCAKALPAPSLNHSSARLNHLVCAFDHPVQMISTRLNPPGLPAPLLPAHSLLPALLGIHEKQTFKALKMSPAVMKVPAAARAPATPPCLSARGGCGKDHQCCWTWPGEHHTAPEKQEPVFAGGETSAFLMALESS